MMATGESKSSEEKQVRKVTIRVPATSANLGPGFDVFGMAVNIWNSVTVERSEEFSMDIEGEGAGILPRGRSNLVIVGLEEAYRVCGKPVPTISYKCQNNIPFGRGLGSSSAAIVSGLLAGFALENHKVSTELKELLNLATKIEGHPDNVSPCISGGLQIGYNHDGDWNSSRVTIPHGLVLVVFIPDHETQTSAAREGLEPVVLRTEAVFNMARAALFVNSFHSGNLDLLRAATEDQLHQSQRGNLHPHMKPLVEVALACGAHGAFLSGAGPSIMAICSGQDGDLICQTGSTRREREVALGMLKKADEIQCGGRVVITSASDRGAHVVPALSDTRSFTNEPLAYVNDKLRVQYV
eukprot:GEMP01016472.1.p1 GENE.GEMP01016472.1~~GEMP01016472.1.p1  ORF type:complete len:354 (+),score=51.71 GEMP01016472.1:59-1120(+)